VAAQPLSGRLIVQDWHETCSSALAEPTDYPGLAGVRKLVLHASDDPIIRFNMVEFESGSEVPPHASPTANYWLVLSGEIDSVVPGREPVTLHQGDCCVQIGVDHGWRVTGGGVARLLAVVVDL
jgi:quercetin dioxygenase-like cupin family protein